MQTNDGESAEESSVDDWPSVLLMLGPLNVKELSADKLGRLQQEVAELESEVRGAKEYVAAALQPAPAWHPADDGFDDQHEFMRALAYSRLPQKTAKQAETQADLDKLNGAVNSPAYQKMLPGLLLSDAHAYIKDLGLDTSDKRGGSSPKSLGGLPLAEVIWQARNQHEHYRDARPFDRPVLDAFRSIVSAHPESFGLTEPPTDDAQLMTLLKNRSWATVLVDLLGWTDTLTLRHDIDSIVVP